MRFVVLTALQLKLAIATRTRSSVGYRLCLFSKCFHKNIFAITIISCYFYLKLEI